MRKTYLYTLDHEQFRHLVGSGESGLAERLMSRYKETAPKSGEAELDDLDELLRAIEAKGSIEPTEDRKTDNLLNQAIWLIAEEAGVDAPAAGCRTEAYEEAYAAFSKSGFLSKPMLQGAPLLAFAALFEGRVYGGEDAWECDVRTAVLDPHEVKELISAMRDLARTRGGKLPPSVQDLLDNHFFPSLEAAGRAQLGILAVTRPL